MDYKPHHVVYIYTDIMSILMCASYNHVTSLETEIKQVCI